MQLLHQQSRCKETHCPLLFGDVTFCMTVGGCFAAQGLVKEFDPSYAAAASATSSSAAALATINGLWNTVLCFGLFLTSVLLIKARSWRFMRSGWNGTVTTIG